MPHYMFIASYSQQGTRGLLAAGGSARRAAVEKMVSSVGGRLESFYYAFGSDDLYAIQELPNAETAASLALTINASGVGSVRTVVLMTPEEVDAAAQVHPDYTPPSAG